MFQPNIQIALNKDGHTWIFEVDCIKNLHQLSRDCFKVKVFASIVISSLENKCLKNKSSSRQINQYMLNYVVKNICEKCQSTLQNWKLMAFDVELKILANLDMDFQKHRNMIPKYRL